mgnify:CR=1 FL=1
MNHDLRKGSIAKRVKDLNTEATNLKTAQFTGWDSVRCYKLETTREWDFDYTPTFVGGQTQENIHIYVKFIADHQEAPFGKAIMEVLVDNTNKYRVGTFSNANTSDFSVYTNGWVPDTFGNYSPTNRPNKINEKSWYNAITVRGQLNIKVKIRVFTTDTGRIIAGYDHNDGEGLFIS